MSELFEARVPRAAALLAEICGMVQIEKEADTEKTVIRIIPQGESDQAKVYTVAAAQSLLVEDGACVQIGTPLTTGARNPRQVLALQGREATARYLLSEVQRVYRTTGVYINDKHIEVIVRQMLRYVQVSDPGDTSLLPGDLVDRFHFMQENTQTLSQGGTPALARPALPGLTRVALQTASWIAAASFQETSRVLTGAAIRGQVDPLRGYKERIVLGARIPTRTP